VVVVIIMVFLIVVMILIMMILIAPDKTSRKQHGDCAQQDRQFQS
jgi:preprotein translocase subunit YajC